MKKRRVRHLLRRNGPVNGNLFDVFDKKRQQKKVLDYYLQARQLRPLFKPAQKVKLHHKLQPRPKTQPPPPVPLRPLNAHRQPVVRLDRHKPCLQHRGNRLRHTKQLPLVRLPPHQLLRVLCKRMVGKPALHLVEVCRTPLQQPLNRVQQPAARRHMAARYVRTARVQPVNQQVVALVAAVVVAVRRRVVPPLDHCVTKRGRAAVVVVVRKRRAVAKLLKADGGRFAPHRLV